MNLRSTLVSLMLLSLAAPAMAAPKKKPAAAAKAKGKGKGKAKGPDTSAEEASLEADTDLGTATPGAPEKPAAGAKAAEGKAVGPRRTKPPETPKGEEPPAVVDLDKPVWNGVDASLGFGVFSRQLKYTDDIFRALRPYDLPLGPVVSLRASALPLKVGDKLRVGAYLRGDLALGLESKNPDGQKFSSSAGVFEVALATRYEMDALALGLRAGYGSQWFSAEAVTGSTSTIEPGIPSVSHGYLFATLTGEYAVAPTFLLNGGFTYLGGLGNGDMSSDKWFPHATSNGFDVQLGGQYKLSDQIGVGLELNYRRIALSMNSVPGDAKVAGGATDDTPGARLYANFHW